MNALRQFLWKNFGITLNRRIFFGGGIILLAILCAVLFAISHNSFLLFLTVITTNVAGVLLLSGSYNLFDWSLSDKERRQQIEEEIALKQMRSRVRSKHFQR